MAICEGHRIPDAQSRCEDRIDEVFAGGQTSWSTLADTVLDIYRHKVQSLGAVEPAEGILSNLGKALLGMALTTQQSSGIYSKLDTHQVGALLLATPNPYVTFEYKDATGYIAFERASPGQQAAALLNLLLNQEAGTLIIDQPEDDLDNKVIMNIVKLVQTTKRRRQLIFATHNPNFVVNGDADKVVALTPGTTEGAQGTQLAARVSIEVDGAIETPAVRSAITDTMEGGKAAFELRSRKYQFSR